VAVHLNYLYIIGQYNVPFLCYILPSFLEVAMGGETFTGRWVIQSTIIQVFAAVNNKSHNYSFIYCYIAGINFYCRACATFTEYPVFSSLYPQMPLAPRTIKCAHTASIKALT
jgi:hypothetical protein